MKNETIYLIKESNFQSFLSDTYTFGCIGFLLYANHAWFGSHGIVAFGLMIMGILSAVARGNKKITKFETLEALQKYLNERTNKS